MTELRRFLRRAIREAALAGCLSLFLARAVEAQDAPAPTITRIDLSAGRSFPIQTVAPVTKITVANPDVADAVVVGERDVVLNGKIAGETDVILFTSIGAARQYRVSVHTAPDRQQVVLAVKLAEVRRDRLNQFGVSYFLHGAQTRAGTNVFRLGSNFTEFPAKDLRPGFDSIVSQTGQLFTNILTNFGSRELQAFIEAERQRGDARVLAEPTLMAANRDSASFLVGGELPIPIVQPNAGGGATVSIVFREFGVRLNFNAEILSDSLIKLQVRPEVSSLDYANAITLSGFRIPALRTRRVATTIDVRRDESLIISGLFNEERERVRTGIPILMDIPILGNLFSSTRWQRNETELLAVVTPSVFNPLRPRPRDTLRFVPDTTRPAREAIEKRLPPAPQPARPPR